MGVGIMGKWKCSLCGYIYDTAVGVQEDGIVSETPFEQLPSDWTCPLCGASKSAFDRE
jgi:rubredoxin